MMGSTNQVDVLLKSQGEREVGRENIANLDLNKEFSSLLRN